MMSFMNRDKLRAKAKNKANECCAFAWSGEHPDKRLL